MEHKIIGYARHVMKVLGKGQKENVYQKALEVRLRRANIYCRSEVFCPILYMGEIVGYGRADLVVDNIIIEFKANRAKPDEASDQLAKYVRSLKAIVKKDYRGLILNFNQATGVLEHSWQIEHVVSRFFEKDNLSQNV